MEVIFHFCGARYQMTHRPVPVRGLGVGDRWNKLLIKYFWEQIEKYEHYAHIYLYFCTLLYKRQNSFCNINY